MNILITGANGQLGNEMQLVSRGSTDKYFFTDVCGEYPMLDITDINAVRAYVHKHAIDVIVNCAAFTDVDAAEGNEALAEKLNAGAPENLAIAMKEAGGLLVHISTDYVFGVETYNTPCREEQEGKPTGIYGLTKLRGEQKIQAAGASHIIIRTAWLYSEFGKNFCKTMLSLTASKPQVKVVFDQVGTPTYALDLAEAITEILKDYKAENSKEKYRKSGVYHFSGEGVCSWYDFAKMIAEYGGQNECEILPCRSHEFPSPVIRPPYSVLDKTKIKETFGVKIPYWTDSLKKCIKNLKNNE